MQGRPEGSPATGVDDVYALGDDLADRSEYVGRERVNDYDVHVLDTVTGAERPLADGPQTEFSPAWSPDGAQIAFVRERFPEQ